jgi:hypothetical protein
MKHLKECRFVDRGYCDVKIESRTLDVEGVRLVHTVRYNIDYMSRKKWNEIKAGWESSGEGEALAYKMRTEKIPVPLTLGEQRLDLEKQYIEALFDDAPETLAELRADIAEFDDTYPSVIREIMADGWW